MRTLKKFNTEAEFNTWKNSPDVRTPYTCLVQETGNVYYDEGSDDDYSVTFVISDDGWVRLFGALAAPQVHGNNKMPTGVTNANIVKRVEKNNTIIYENGVFYVEPDVLAGRWHRNNGTGGPGYLSGDHKPEKKTYCAQIDSHKPCGARRYLYCNKGDVIKIYLYKSIIPQYMFQSTENQNIKEIIIGDGIKNIGKCAFYGHTADIFVGRGVRRISGWSLSTSGKVFFNPGFNKYLLKVPRKCGSDLRFVCGNGSRKIIYNGKLSHHRS